MSRKTYYTVEILYQAGTETRLHRVTNLDTEALHSLRMNMYIQGVYRRIDDDTGEILSPWNIIETMVYRQAHFFNALEGDKPFKEQATQQTPKK